MLVLPLSIGVAATIRIGFRLKEGESRVDAVPRQVQPDDRHHVGLLHRIFTSLLRERIEHLYNDTSAVVLWPRI